MPAGVIRGPEAEKTWESAVAAAKKQYPGLKSKDSDRFYAIVMTIYKSMCKNKACSPKRESMSAVLGRIELLESKMSLPGTYKEWLLYEPVDKDLTKKAISDLNSALKKAAADLVDGMKKRAKGTGRLFEKDVDGAALSKAWDKYVKPVLDNRKYSDVGFQEPEPRVIAGQKLIDVIKGFYGIKGWTSLGDYI